MRSDDWYLTHDLDDFLTRAGAFLHSRPALHTVPLSVTETLRTRGRHVYGEGVPEFGVLERDGAVRASLFRTPPHWLNLTALTAEEADALAARLAALGQRLPGVNADFGTAAAFAEAWQRHTGVTAALPPADAETPHPPSRTGNTSASARRPPRRLVEWQRPGGVAHHIVEQEAAQTKAAAATHEQAAAEEELLAGRQRQRLYRLGTLTVPRPVPPGRPRIAGEADREQLVRWWEDFHEDVGQGTVRNAAEWADARIERGGVTFWETPDGTPVAMAGTTPEVAGQVRVALVYTPPHLRGRGYAGAATAEVSRAALAAGVDEVLLFTDLANPTSNGLYQRIGYRAVADFAVYDFT